MKKIWLLCLFLVSLSLTGCFHVPDEDWLPSKSNIETWDIKKDEEMEQALNSFIEGIDVVSTQRDELNKDENYNNVENLDEIGVEAEETFDNEITSENNAVADDENKIQEVEYDTTIE